MGILNVTPDSFFDGGRYEDPAEARRQIDRLQSEGATIVDIGAESTRPGAALVPAKTQLERALPSIEYAIDRGLLVSIDTSSPEVAALALERGAHIINDVSCLADASLARLCAKYDAPLIVMHSRGPMAKMSYSSYPEEGYGDVVENVQTEWRSAQGRAIEQGMKPDIVWFDPGLGFHKNALHSTLLLRRFAELMSLSPVVVLGASRKSFIGALDDSRPENRIGGSLTAALRGVEAVAASPGTRLILRVHDVFATRQALLARQAFAPIIEREARRV